MGGKYNQDNAVTYKIEQNYVLVFMNNQAHKDKNSKYICNTVDSCKDRSSIYEHDRPDTDH